MIQICYEETGRILFTVDGEVVPDELDGNWVAYDGPKLCNLAAWRIINDTVTLVDLGPAKLEAVLQINEAVGRARLTYVTDIPGQQAIYSEKADEARAYVALVAEPETLNDFPMLAAEIGITAPTAWQLSQVWLYMAGVFKGVAAQTESQRLGAIGQIGAAMTLLEINTIMEEFPLK